MQDVDDVVLVARGFAAGMRRQQHVRHRPQRRVRRPAVPDRCSRVPAPAMRPSRNAAISAASSTQRPRAALTRKAEGCIARERVRVDHVRRSPASADRSARRNRRLRQQRLSARSARAPRPRRRRPRTDRGESRSRACRTPWQAAPAGRRSGPRPTIEQGLAAESSSRCGQVADHAAPELSVPGCRAPPAAGARAPGSGHRVLRHRAGVDARRRRPGGCRAPPAPRLSY